MSKTAFALHPQLAGSHNADKNLLRHLLHQRVRPRRLPFRQRQLQCQNGT